MKQVSDYHFYNWGKNCDCRPCNYFQPATEDELAGIISSSSKIRLTGTGHSWSTICLTSDSMVNTDLYSQVISLDKEKKQVRLQPGMKLWQLNNYLDKEGLALENLGSISKQSVAGAISTGTHGTGINYRILASQVEEFTLLTANGDRRIIHCERDKEMFDTAIVNLGALGVISEITLNVVPAFCLREQSYVANFDETIEQLDELIQENDHFKLWWFPHSDEVVVYRYTRTYESVNDSRLRQWLMEEVLSVLVYRLFLKIGQIHRDWRKNINRLLVQKFIQPLDRIEKSYKVFNVPEPPLHREVEWAFDLKVARELLQEYKRMINSSKHRINFLQEIRFSKADEYALSPSFGRDSIWLGAYNADNYGWDDLKTDFESFARGYKGRPHWGKEFTLDADYLQKAYPHFDRFNTLRRQLDPQGKFANDYIIKIFS